MSATASTSWTSLPQLVHGDDGFDMSFAGWGVKAQALAGDHVEPESCAHVAPGAHAIWQPPPSQSVLHVAPDAHCMPQAPPSQSMLHVAPGAHCMPQWPPLQSMLQVDSPSHAS